MKKISVKLRITLWLTLMMLLLSGILLFFMLSVSSAVVDRTAREQLSQTMQRNLTQVDFKDNALDLGQDFHFYQSGVSTLIYNKNQALLAGQVPVSFKVDEPFQNGMIRMVNTEDTRFLVLDFWLPQTWETGLWVRGVMEAPDSSQTVRNFLRVALLAMPTFIALAALGGYLILRGAFRPLDRIIATAKAINEAKDLSQRIGLPPDRDEFSRLAGTFDELFRRLERSFEAEKQFTADASHELRTPVSVIKSACEYSRKYAETEEERQESLDTIQRQADKMTHLISQLLSMTRLEQGTEQARFETVNLGSLTRDLCRERNYDAQRLILEIQEDVTAKGDPALLSRLIENLIDNAFKYGRPDGRVWVSVSRRDGELLLNVRDNGVGIPPEEQEKIWNRFYQVDASRSGACGAGLGLSMVRQIAQLHSGTMTLESVPDVGSSFTLHLPDSQNEVNYQRRDDL